MNYKHNESKDTIIGYTDYMSLPYELKRKYTGTYEAVTARVRTTTVSNTDSEFSGAIDLGVGLLGLGMSLLDNTDNNSSSSSSFSDSFDGFGGGEFGGGGASDDW